METHLPRVNLTTCDVLNTNCNLNPGGEVARGEITVLGSLA